MNVSPNVFARASVLVVGFSAILTIAITSAQTSSPQNSPENMRRLLMRDGAYAQTTYPVHVRSFWPNVPRLYQPSFGPGTRAHFLSFPENVSIADMYETRAGNLFVVATYGSEFAMPLEQRLYFVSRSGGAPIVKLMGPASGPGMIHGITFVLKGVNRALFNVLRNGPDDAGPGAAPSEMYAIDGDDVKMVGHRDPDVPPILRQPSGDCAIPKAEADDVLRRGFVLVSNSGSGSIVSAAEAKRATKGLVGRQGVVGGCKRLGNEYIAWINTEDEYSDGITFRVSVRGTMTPLFLSYPQLQTAHYVLFVDTPKSAVFRNLLVQDVP